jgi:hypothetical protein
MKEKSARYPLAELRNVATERCFAFARQGAERAEPLLAWAIKLQDQERPVSRCFPKPREKGAHHLRNECPRKTGLPKANEVPSVRVITKYRKVTESHAGSGDVSSQFVTPRWWAMEVRRRGVVIVTNCRGILPENGLKTGIRTRTTTDVTSWWARLLRHWRRGANSSPDPRL